MSALRIFHGRRPAALDAAMAADLHAALDAYRQQARKDAILIEAQGRAIRDLRRQVAELRAQLAATVEVER